jgi:putative peptide zinc metalloprotease protein
MSLTLPLMREELTLHPGPIGEGGAPSWRVHDPLRNQFFQLTWTAFEILSRWHMGTDEAVAGAVSAETTLRVTPERVREVVGFLARAQLLRARTPADTKWLLALADGARSTWLTWLLHHYLFFRLPLIRPDAWLTRTLPWVAWLGRSSFRLATLAALLAGLVLVEQQWDHFSTTLVDRLTVGGLTTFALTLCVAKTIHELGHAFTAKAFGCRVPAMGVAFLVMWPLPYTDVNEAWKLPERRERLFLGGAGIIAELTLAAWATFAWGLLPDGTLREAAFILAATSWLSSVTINLSPFMRFDGYFLLLDALDMPNLHARAFAFGRWWLRETLFDLGDPIPERLGPGRRRFLVGFAFLVWLYRLVLFLGIAALVYHFFIKAVGILLFAVEAGWFVLLPFAREFAVWRRRATDIRASLRGRATIAAALLILLLLLLPLNARIAAPAMLKAADHTDIYAIEPARLTALLVHDGQRVKAGDVLVRLESPDIDYQLATNALRITKLHYELDAIAFDDAFRNDSPVIAQELTVEESQRAALLAKQAHDALAAPFDGIVTNVSPDDQVGQWMSIDQPFMTIRRDRGGRLDAFIQDADLPRIAIGASATLIPDDGSPPLAAKITGIDRTGSPDLLDDPALAKPFGGPIPARVSRQALIPDGAVYHVRLSVDDLTLQVPMTKRGTVVIQGDRRTSLLGRVWRNVVAVLLRQWDF